MGEGGQRRSPSQLVGTCCVPGTSPRSSLLNLVITPWGGVGYPHFTNEEELRLREVRKDQSLDCVPICLHRVEAERTSEMAYLNDLSFLKIEERFLPKKSDTETPINKGCLPAAVWPTQDVGLVFQEALLCIHLRFSELHSDLLHGPGDRKRRAWGGEEKPAMSIQVSGPAGQGFFSPFPQQRPSRSEATPHKAGTEWETESIGFTGPRVSNKYS